jgi:type IV pilus assembly protein PilC
MLVIHISDVFQAYWYLVLGLLIGAIVLSIYAYRHYPAYHRFIDKYSLRIPIVGDILKKAAIARFARTLSITFAAGLPLFDALRLVEGATGNVLFAEATAQIREVISTGQVMQHAMVNTALFPNMVIQMVAIGEESGNLESMLGKVADYYEAEVDSKVDNLSTLIEPIIICVLGVLVGGLVVAMYLPIFKLGSVI